MAQSRPLTAAAWLGRADQFWMAAQALIQSPMGLATFPIPAVTCQAFATEAYLKGLLTLRGAPFPNDHNLLELFKRLPIADRESIEARWNIECLPNALKSKANAPAGFNIPTSLRGALKQSKNAFVLWRYFSEDLNEGIYFGVDLFPVFVRELILQAHPEWRTNPPDGWGKQRQRPSSENPNNSRPTTPEAA